MPLVCPTTPPSFSPPLASCLPLLPAYHPYVTWHTRVLFCSQQKKKLHLYITVRHPCIAIPHTQLHSKSRLHHTSNNRPNPSSSSLLFLGSFRAAFPFLRSTPRPSTSSTSSPPVKKSATPHHTHSQTKMPPSPATLFTAPFQPTLCKPHTHSRHHRHAHRQDIKMKQTNTIKQEKIIVRRAVSFIGGIGHFHCGTHTRQKYGFNSAATTSSQFFLTSRLLCAGKITTSI